MRIAYRRRFGVGVFLACLLSGLLTPTASAAVPLGGGAPIGVGDGNCTLATIGHDNTGELVGFTAAHCGDLGAQVVTTGIAGPVGSVVVANGALDYAVIKFDPAKVTPTANFAGFPINGLGPDPGFRQPACWQGAVSGNYCTYFATIPAGPRGSSLWQKALQGDDGGPVTSNGLLVGMILDTYDHVGGQMAPWPATRVQLFSAILADRNASGGPGAGFNPVPT